MFHLKSYLLLATLLVSFLLVSNTQARMYLYGGGTYAPGDTVNIEVNLSDNERSELKLYHIKNPQKVLEFGGPNNFEGSSELDLNLLRSYPLKKRLNRYYETIKIENLPIGMYFAQAGGGEDAAATLILVTDLGMVVKSDKDKILTYTANLTSGKPKKSSVYLLSNEGIVDEVLSDNDGLAELEHPQNSPVMAANSGSAWAFSRSYWSSWNIKKSKVYVHTDRSIYRPTHIVYFKGTARSPAGLEPLANEEALVVIRDADYDEIYRQSLTTDEYGSFNGELILGAEPPLGRYSIETSVLGETHHSEFSVEEFQKPEYKVTVAADESITVQGGKTRFVIKGEYLFGGPVAGGQVNYAVLKQPYYRYRYTSRYGFYEEHDYTSYYGGEMIDRGEGVLNEEGELELEIDLPLDSQDYQITIQAGVTDEARREISGSGNITAYRAGIVLNVSTDRYAYEEGEDAQVRVRAEDLEGNPVSVPFELTSERYYWRAKVGRQKSDTEVIDGETDENGEAVLTLPFTKQGSYNLVVEANDEGDRTTTATDYVWVSGNSRWYWAYDAISIKADKPEYVIGETARFVIQSPVEDAYVLITREGEALESAELIRLDGSALTYELEITEDMSPNGYLAVALMGDGEMHYETAGFKVPPVGKFLNVEITSDSDKYQPGEVGTFDLRLSNEEGKGVQAQVALALVDEAIFLVRPDNTPDIRGFFYALKGNVVGTQLSAWYYFGRADTLAKSAAPAEAFLGEAREAMDESVFAQSKESGFAEAELRQDFRDTILWLPTLETDENGLATVEVTFPDNLTEWRLTARAITLDDKVGENTYAVTTTLPVIARLASPRFFIRGDGASLRVIGQSNLETDQTGQLELAAEGFEIANAEPQAIELPANARVTADFDVTAADTGTAYLTATALTTEASDAMKIPVPVLPHGIREELGWADSGSSTWTFNLPEKVDLNSTQGTLYLTPSLAAAVSPALAYLAGYPYGCTEQTMSRFLPSVLATQAGDLAMLPEDIAKNLDDIVKKGLKRLYSFQHSDGGWGFWQYDESNPFITAYVVNGLIYAREAGFNVRGWVLKNAIGYLQEFVASDTPYSNYRLTDSDARAYAYYVLARDGRNISGLGSKIGRNDMSPYGKALSALALAIAGYQDRANVYLDSLLADVTEHDRFAYWETGAERYYWNDDQIEATAYALEALAHLRPDEAIITKVVNWLLLERKGARWVSTKDTAAVIKAALVLAEVKGESSAQYNVRVSLNNLQREEQLIIGQQSEALEINLNELQAGKNELEIAVSGSGTLYLSANVSFFEENNFIKSNTQHFGISRSYELLVPAFDKLQERYVYTRNPLKEAKVGDYILVTVKIKPKGNYRYVLINEPLPAGYRIIENDHSFRIAGLKPRYGYNYYGWNYWYDGRDVRDERVDYYFTYLRRPVEFTYILRAETPGTFAALPTQAWLMYEPEVRGVGKQKTLHIIDSE